MSRISPLGIRLTIYAAVLTVLTLLLLFGWDALLAGICSGRLKRMDPEATLGDAAAAGGILVLDDIQLPTRGISLDRALIYWHGGPFSPEADSVNIVGGSIVIGGRDGPDIPASENATGPPPVIFSDIRAVHPALGDLLLEGRLSGIDPGDSANFFLRCSWADGMGTVSFMEGADSVRMHWFRCVTGETGLPGLPDILDGHSVTGTLRGRMDGGLTAEGGIHELDGERVEMSFTVGESGGGPLIGIQVELGEIREFLSETLRDMLSAELFSMVPSGDLQVTFTGGDTLEIQVRSRIDSLVIVSPGLSEDTVNLDASLEFHGMALHEEGRISIDSGSVTVGSASVWFSLYAVFRDDPWLSLRLWTDSLSGEDLASSVPAGLLGRLEGLRLGGWAAFDISMELDWAEPDSCDFTAMVDVSRLAVLYSPVSVGLFREGGSCRMRDTWGNSRLISLEPDDSTFVPVDSLHPSLEGVLRCAEDATFRSHSGFSEYHVRNSIRANIESGAFVRGGSTLSMQLARNLLLDRDKNLARKVQEVFLTWRLETYLSKDRILEIYARIVELGPDVFGFQEAAVYYFGEELNRLTTREVAYIVSILPGPRLYHRFFSQGRVPGYWEDYIDRLLAISSDRGWIAPDSAAKALAESIVFRASTDPSD